ncbi:MAG: transcriptional repressor LexA [Candidatus Krumholzibacteria bacterium]|nr:transcriptional repressor LexA [Candidatus Krumholzibacteria bacterium]
MVYLTKRQREILEFIREFQARNGYAPSLEEIGKRFGLSAVSTVHEHLTNLARKGALTRGWNRARSIEPLEFTAAAAATAAAGIPPAADAAAGYGTAGMAGARVPAGGAATSRAVAFAGVREVVLAGTVAAGSPIEALEVPESIALPPGLAGRGETFALRVKGMSMTGDGILDGDTIIVEKRQRVENGALAVAVVDGSEATVKRFYQRGDTVTLKPSNPKMEEIVLAASRVEVRGVVTGLIRSYRQGQGG